MTCYKDGGCGIYEMYSCTECPASKPEYLNKRKTNLIETCDHEKDSKAEVINYLSEVKRRGVKVLGEHKRMKRQHFELFMNTIIQKVEDIL